MRKTLVEQLLTRINVSREFVGNPVVFDAFLISIIVTIRSVLEIDESKNDYPILDLYCDWFLHCRLDKQKANRHLTALMQTILEHGKNPLVNDEINKTIGLERLRDEILTLLQKHEYDLRSKEWWDCFFARTLRLLLGKPLKYRIKNDYFDCWNLKETDVILRLVDKNKQPFWEISIPEMFLTVTGPIGFDPKNG